MVSIPELIQFSERAPTSQDTNAKGQVMMFWSDGDISLEYPGMWSAATEVKPVAWMRIPDKATIFGDRRWKP